ncbi:MAG: radical SAM protein [Candidatus Woesearchaeota archaeon]|nr:radical SAM protein [Candidatus Woesearchaeota archaeon]
MKAEKTQYYSWKIGNLPKGCKYCVKGEKTVLFITGLCSKKETCYYCPISDLKKDKDVVYANEWKIENDDNIIKEIKLCDSKGVGITGGDPLVVLERTIHYIKLLKERFGKDFHIHLYTPLELVDLDKLKKLSESGLDEIRFHPDINDDILWNKILLAKEFRWNIGVEIPVIPNKEKEIKKLIDFIDGKVRFLNLNELEISDSNANKLNELGFYCKDDISYGIKDSEELALRLLEYCKNKNLDVHYCTVRLKDAIQLANRIKRRARNVKESFDELTKEGTLIRGAIYLKELKPSFGYRRKLDETKNREEIIEKLKDIKEKLNFKDIKIDEQKLRLLTSLRNLKLLKNKLKEMDLVAAKVEEFPTYDQFEVEIEFL